MKLRKVLVVAVGHIGRHGVGAEVDVEVIEALIVAVVVAAVDLHGEQVVCARNVERLHQFAAGVERVPFDAVSFDAAVYEVG